jgi:hypothetical protein
MPSDWPAHRNHTDNLPPVIAGDPKLPSLRRQVMGVMLFDKRAGFAVCNRL